MTKTTSMPLKKRRRERRKALSALGAAGWGLASCGAAGGCSISPEISAGVSSGLSFMARPFWGNRLTYFSLPREPGRGRGYGTGIYSTVGLPMPAWGYKFMS